MDYVLSLSYGKDSITTLYAIKKLGLPLTRVCTADIWATDTILAEFPLVVEFKKYIDKYIYDNFNIKVEHFTCTKVGNLKKDKITYEDLFFRVLQSGKRSGEIYGWPKLFGSWCVKLKVSSIPIDKNDILYLGIAADEFERIERHSNRDNVVLPLVLLGLTESDCLNYCRDNGLLSPAYDCSFRSGCWFCHKQSLNQLRNLYLNYPDLWELLLKWDNSSPVPFRANGLTVSDFDKRFYLESIGCFDSDKKFYWSMLDENLQLSLW